MTFSFKHLTMITINNLVFGYANSPNVFDGFSWQVHPSETWSIIGPSGCGKSTLLYLIAGLKHPLTGEIRICDQPITRPRPGTGLILQDFGLLPWATVRQNVELGLRVRRFYGPDGKHTPRDYNTTLNSNTRVDEWLARLNIAEQADKFPSQISGGQRQRTAIARTLVLEPDLLLMDEPFSALDAPTRENLQNVIIELHQETNLTVVSVTHNIEEAVMLGQNILVLKTPPNKQPSPIQNPQAGLPNYRNSSAYIERCNEIRHVMGLVS